MSGANGVIDQPGGASVEAMDTSDASNSVSSRFTVKPSTMNKQQSNKPISPGKYSLLSRQRSSIVSS